LDNDLVIGGNLLICKNEHKVTRVSLYQVIEKQIDPITIRRKHRSLLDVTVKCGIRMSLLWILLQLKIMEVVVTSKATRCAKLQSICHHQQTYPALYRPHV